MLTPEGADDTEVIVRPAAYGRWQVEIPTGHGVAVNLVDDERAAIAFAHAVRPGADIRVLPAAG
ncbi:MULTISPECIES: hypothetical protein [unclassified Caballeronia]|uniref:hypothetical protein n=1 Tax=unclassified Caballeronia TaxID=2646786 RepID=UPI00285A310D|nr:MULTISPECIES: hypothetical protein [unclassified Caballeronia]MDR5777476.1 hypothetical protein [Caballeronia sp. LZ002]MDR5806419.1 hypothetical protein [Caballeronia sp. LZ001]MDR5852923.1 hypothetical protein [Caballeronia sp. LZ003]